MSQRNYLDYVTERVNDGLNFNRNHRFFLVYGRLTDDEFLTRSMYRTTLRETLWATLKSNQIERVIFYNAAEKFFFLDEESARLSDSLGGAAAAEARPHASPAAGAASPRMQRGPLGGRNVLTRPTRMVRPGANEAAQPGASSSDRDQGGQSSVAAAPASSPVNGSRKRFEIISMSRSRGAGMSDSAVLTNLNDFIRDHSVRTAIVIEELENLSRFDHRIKDQLAARLREWNALLAENRNVLIFITNREPGDEQGIALMKNVSHEFPEIANLINIALGEQRAEADGFIWYMPPPYEPEIERLIDETRLKHNIPIDWSQRDRIVRCLAAGNMQLKKLDGLFREYVRHLRVEGEKISLELIRRRGWSNGDSDPRSAMERLRTMIGMTEIKGEVDRLINYLQAEKKRRERSPELASEPLNLHLMLTGNPGTGKTTVARLIGEIYRDIGLLRRGHTVDSDRSKLVGEYEGQTAPKTNNRINEALDGVLFIDEAYALKREGEDPFGKEAVDTLVARMENERHHLAVIVAGYPNEMEKFITSNAGLSRRFQTKIHLRDYLPEELLQIFEQRIGRQGHTINGEMRDTMLRLFTRMYELREDRNYFGVDEQGKSAYGNAGEVRNLAEEMLKEQANRLGGEVSQELTPEDIPAGYRKFLGEVRQGKEGEEELKRLMAELDALVGLQPVKEFVQKLVREQKLAIILKRGISSAGKTRHMLFTGNPGTGKTTVARLVGQIYKALGILSGSHFIEAQRGHLVGQYVGETTQKTNKVIEKALDGVLFIDEAYSLSQQEHDFGYEAINTLVPALENYRNRLVVIFAGYTREMQSFVDANSGIESRVGYTIEFPDYTGHELLEIFLRLSAEAGYDVPEDVRRELLRQFTHLSTHAGKQFGNARGVRVRFYDRMVEELERRMFEAHESGQDISTFPRAFMRTDVPSVAPALAAQATTPNGRTHHFRMSDLAGVQQGAALYNEQESPESVGRAVGFVRTEKGSGTGFVISPEGHLLTAHHVVAGARSIQFRLNGTPHFIDAEYLDGDEEADLAILKIKGRDLSFARIVAPGYPLRFGTPLGLLGYPMGEALGTEVTYTCGPLSSIRQSPEGVSIFQIDVSAYAGNSGGPVFLSQTGEVIGVLSYGPNDTLNFAVSVEELYQRFK